MEYNETMTNEKRNPLSGLHPRWLDVGGRLIGHYVGKSILYVDEHGDEIRETATRAVKRALEPRRDMKKEG